MANWRALLEFVDYHHGRWYEYSGGMREWEQCGETAVHVYLKELAPGEDHDKIIKQFVYRDRESHARPKNG